MRLVALDHVHIKVEAEPSILAELYDRFTFTVPGFKFMPLFKAGGNSW